MRIFFMVPALSLFACNEPAVSVKVAGAPLIAADDSTKSDSETNYLTLEDATAVLGEPSHKMEGLVSKDKDAERVHCSYSANAGDERSGKTGTIYFLLEKYKSEEKAKERYSFIYDSNKDHDGVQKIAALGDEAYFHSDGTNFYFIMVRKGDKVFNMKVNKITSKTSREQFDAVARKITASLNH